MIKEQPLGTFWKQYFEMVRGGLIANRENGILEIFFLKILVNIDDVSDLFDWFLFPPMRR